MNCRNVLLVLLVISFSCKKKLVETTPIVEKGRNVVILGSSTAFGAGASPIDSSWANRLKRKISSDFQDIEVYNLAQGGYTTYEIQPKKSVYLLNRPIADTLRNIEKALSLKPGLVIINLPSNDIARGYSDNEILNNFKTVSNILSQNKIPFLITSTQPRNLPDFAARKRLKDFNDQLLSIIPNNVLNYYDLLAESGTLNLLPNLNSGDGVHVNNKGHFIIYDEILKDKRTVSALTK